TIAIVALLFVERGRNGDLQSTIGIKFSSLLGELVTAIIALTAFSIRLGFISSAAGPELVLTVIEIEERRPIRRAMHHILDLGSGYGLAEVVFRFNGCSGLVALEKPRLIRGDTHLIFWLLVFLNLEPSGHSVTGTCRAVNRNVVVAESGVSGKRQ